MWPSVGESVSKVWLPKAMSHSFISIILTFSLKHYLCALRSAVPLRPLPLSTPNILLIPAQTTRGPCVHNKQQFAHPSQLLLPLIYNSSHFLFMWCGCSGSRCNGGSGPVITRRWTSNDELMLGFCCGTSAQDQTDRQPQSHKDK